MTSRGSESREAPRDAMSSVQPQDTKRSSSRFSAFDLVRRHLTGLALGAYGVLLATFALYHLRVSLARSWFFSSDEYVFAAEVIRFLHLDFHQYYFDMPGTPYMLLTTVLWALFRPYRDDRDFRGLALFGPAAKG